MPTHTPMRTCRRRPLARAAVWLLPLALAGCLPQRAVVYESRPAPAVPQETATPEQAYWREQYRNNRPEAPEHYRVDPVPPRNNSFAEFEETLYSGLDRQPELPDLPGGFGPVPGGGPADLSVAPARPVPANNAANPNFQPTRLTAPAGITADNHFYPIEQLVYGGDYPDLDKPERYRLMPKDVVLVAVRDHPEFSGQMEIQPDGTVRIPHTSDLVRLRGLTTDEAADAIKNTVTVYVKGECVVRVQANRARGGYYIVLGDVQQPGRFPMGLEPVKLSDAVLAANWEANPARRDADGDELGPSFPAAAPRGKYIAPASADLARVMLITPHRSQPVRTVHDIRAAMMGVTANDPIIRPGQIVVVPSLVAERNRELGLESPPDGLMPGQGFSTANSPARLPEVTPPARPVPVRNDTMSMVETNMAHAFDTNMNAASTKLQEGVTVYENRVTGPARATAPAPAPAAAPATSAEIAPAPPSTQSVVPSSESALADPSRQPRRTVYRRKRRDISAPEERTLQSRK